MRLRAYGLLQADQVDAGTGENQLNLDHIPDGATRTLAGGAGPTPTAGVIPINDAGGYYVSGYVEGALQEIGVAFAAMTIILNGKAPTSHSHVEGDVTNLTSDLAGKAAASHTHAEGDVTNLSTDLGNRELTANKGAVSGYAPLDAAQLLPTANLPNVPYTNLPTGASTNHVLPGDHASVTNSRTPTTHASSHAPGAADPVKRWHQFGGNYYTATACAFGTTRYAALQGLQSGNATRTLVAMTLEQTGTFKNLRCYCNAFTTAGAGNVSTVTIDDDNTDPGSISVVINGTGWFSSAGPSGSVAGGSLVSFKIVTGGTSGQTNIATYQAEWYES